MGATQPPTDSHSPPLQTFLIVDIRGSTRYGVERGDEAWAALAMRFAQVAREVVEARGGRVVELRGDEAMAVFASARAALQAAVALQARFAAEMRSDPSLQLHAGIGLDAGEAVPVEGGFRGLALNLAARLCSLAGPGEVLASETVIGLAHAVAGLAYTDRGLATLKGFAAPVRVLQVSRQPQAAHPPPAADVPEHPAPGAGQPAQTFPVGGFLGALPAGPLVAREAEVALLRSAVEAVAGGAGRLVLLVGEPGVGKTRLAQELTLLARDRGFLVASGRCYEPQGSVPYFPFLEVLTRVYAASPASIRDELPHRWAEVARLLPDQSIGASAGRESSGGNRDDRQRLFWQVSGFLQALIAVQPVAVLLDDLHWADTASLDLLQHLARQIHDRRILLLGTYRDVEVSRAHPLEAALRDLTREKLVERIAVKRLSLDGTRALIGATMREVSISDDFAHLLYERTEGNPFFTQEVVQALVERGDLFRRDGEWDRKAIEEIEVPESVRSVIGQRLAHMGDDTQEVLHEASVLGQTFGFDVLATMSGRDEGALERALEEAMAAGLVHEAGRDDYAFHHALIQQALYRELPTRKRRRLHRSAGEALGRLPEGKREGRAAELAYHFLEADEGERALPYAIKAGDAAEAVYAHAEAEKHYRTAVQTARELGDAVREAAALEGLGQALRRRGRYLEAIAALDEAAASLRALSDLEGQRRTVAQAARLYGSMARPQEGLDRLRPLLVDADDAPGSPGLTWLHHAAASLYFIAGRYDEMLQFAERAAALARAAGDEEALMHANERRGVALMLLGEGDAALAAIEEMQRQAERLGRLDMLMAGSTHLGSYHWLYSGDMLRFQRHYERAYEYAERLGDPERLGFASMNVGDTCYYLGDWERAQACAERAERFLREADLVASWGMPYVQCLKGKLALVRGEREVGMTLLEASGAAALATGDQHVLPGVDGALAEAELLEGHVERARARLEPWEAAERQREATAVLQVLPALAWANVEDRRPEEAEASVSALLKRAAVVRTALADAHRIQGLLRLRQGRFDEAAAALEVSLARTRAMPYPYAEAKALFVYGQLHTAKGEPERAREKYEAALAICERLGEGLYRPHIERALAMMRGVTPAQDGASERD